jgi:hypothetical protein
MAAELSRAIAAICYVHFIVKMSGILGLWVLVIVLSAVAAGQGTGDRDVAARFGPVIHEALGDDPRGTAYL